LHATHQRQGHRRGFFRGAKARIIRNLTDAMVEIEGEGMRPVTWTVVEEVKSGDWGIAGKPLATADVLALAATRPAKTG
jgi:4-oxalocrotonate tautomerase